MEEISDATIGSVPGAERLRFEDVRIKTHADIGIRAVDVDMVQAMDLRHAAGGQTLDYKGVTSPMSLWVKSRHVQRKTSCPLYPPKATSTYAMSAKGQKQTFHLLFDQLVGAPN